MKIILYISTIIVMISCANSNKENEQKTSVNINNKDSGSKENQLTYIDSIWTLSKTLDFKSKTSTIKIINGEEWTHSHIDKDLETIQITKIEKNILYTEQYLLKGNNLIYAIEQEKRPADVDDENASFWNCEYIVKENSVIDYISLGMGKTEGDFFNPEDIITLWESHKTVYKNIKNKDSIKNQAKINFTDSNNLKQGKWIKKNKTTITSIKNYRNDTLHGYTYDWQGMQSDGYYNMGLKEGFFRVYYDDKKDDKVLSLKLFEKDSVIWSTCPAADENYLIPIKGIHVYSDSVYLKAPYSNNQTWYEGLFINRKAKGKHITYYRDGKIKGIVNYNDHTIKINENIDNSIKSLYKRNWDVEIIKQN